MEAAHWVASACVAASAAAIGTWWFGRFLVRAPADAMLSMRVQRYRARVGAVVVFTSVVVSAASAVLPSMEGLRAGLVPYTLAMLLAASFGAVAGGTPVARVHFSDRRAAELCGDPEELVRALVAVHEANRVPRRMAASDERRGTHPSLARRIRAIRGESPEPVGAREFAGRGSDAARLTVSGDGLRWEGGLERFVPLDRVVELRVALESRDPTLHALETDGTRHSFEVREEDVAALEAQLDAVDARLAPMPSRPSTRGLASLVQLVVLLGALVLLLGGFPPLPILYLVLAGLVGALRWTRPAAAALGAMSVALVAHAAMLRDSWSATSALAAVAVGAAGVALLGMAARDPLERPGRPRRTAAAHAVAAGAFLVLQSVAGEHRVAAVVAGEGELALLPWCAAGAVLAVLGPQRRLGLAMILLAAAAVAVSA